MNDEPTLDRRDVLQQLADAAALRRDARRRLADVTAVGGERVGARKNYVDVTARWAFLIREAVIAHRIPDVARAAGCTRATVYARSREPDTGGTSDT